MPLHREDSRTRTTGRRSQLWVALSTSVVVLGLAGFVVAAGRTTTARKLVPLGEDAKAKKVLGMKPDADATVPSRNAPAAKSKPAIVPLDVPSNDDCSGAIAIPDGPFPLVTQPVDITDATPQEEDDGFHPCTFPAPEGLPSGGDRTIWYSFTPSVTGAYVFSTCEGNGATGNTVYDTVISVFASIGGACPVPGSGISCNDSATGCSTSSPDAPYVDQSTTIAPLEAGNTYFISVGHWAADIGGVAPGLSDVAILVDITPAPDNDTCSGALPLTLNRVTTGSTFNATNDYRAQGDAACFSGIGQVPNTAPGIDVVYSFAAPEDGKYSFRYVQDDADAALRSQNPTLYLSDVCPAPAPASAVPCIKGANRITASGPANGNRSEEIDCVPLTSGEQVYLFFDDRGAGNLGGPMAVEVTKCTTETEPNDDVATATPYPGCFLTASAGTAGDVDFYDLGSPPAGSKIFAAVDAASANDGDFEMRITTATDTLGYDDNDGTSWISSNAPIVSGVIADGSETYVRVNKGSAAAQLVASEPYRLYARIETGTAQDEVDLPPFGNASYYFGNHVTGGGFVKGVMASQTDQDCFRFVAHEGDEIVVFSDNNPDRVPGTITNVWPVLRDLVFEPPTATRFVGQVVRNDVTPSPGTLTGVTPSVTSEFFPYRARYTGLYMACFTPTQDAADTENPPAGAYPLPYQGSISLNCGPVPAPASRITDVSITKTGPIGPVNTGDIIDYTITLTNDTGDIAEDVRLEDSLPAQLVFMNLTVDDGFSGANVGCLALPIPGSSGAPIDCTVFSIAPGASVTYTLQVQVANCIGAGIDVANTATITTLSTDPNQANDSSTWTFTTSESGSCNDLLCDPDGCVANACTVNDHCDAGECVSEAANCDDNSLCTDDSCDPTDGDGNPCINDPSQLGDLCFDGNDCTIDSCDPLLFCVFPAGPADSACDDFLNCTDNDHCDGAGSCVSHSVCDDGQPCTDDFADELNACACTNPIAFEGTVCDDGSVCTSDTVCDGNGGAAANCGGGTTLDCDDANPCTDDSCDPVAGCVHANNTAACTDGDACTSGDVCAGGTCGSGSPLVCNDGNVCTTDSCNPASGCVFVNNTAACDDGDGCTAGDTCSGGVCSSGAPADCNDANPCTDDLCFPAEGCVHNQNTNACDDGDGCTIDDVCSGGACTGGAPFVCDDGDACTAEVCITGTGCVAAPVNLDATGFSESRVDGRDLVVFAIAWNSCPATPFYNPAANLDQGTTPPGSCVDLTDFHLFMNAFGQSCP